MSATGVGDAARDDAVAAVRALLGPDVEPVLAGAVALPTSSVRGDLAPLRALATWERVAALLAGPAAERALAVKDARPDGAPPPADVEALRALAGDGRTVVLRRLERFDPDAARVAAAFARTFGAAPDVHLYRTPAGASGFGWHYDLEDVFLLQLEGSKEYLLRKNTVDPFPSGDRPPADMRYERERSPTFACRLTEGD
ncbi:MAG TPA: cupin domain-containing protein, partial [Planctomycetota bacterium]|nr:cupin domain-containing protein [Planctomycetota bacterium]